MTLNFNLYQVYTFYLGGVSFPEVIFITPKKSLHKALILLINKILIFYLKENRIKNGNKTKRKHCRE